MADTPVPSPLTLYWRPGCGFCMALKAQLKVAGIGYDPVNIWEDDEARALVASVNDGNETVPTVRIGSQYLTNPGLRQVKKALAEYQGRGL